MTNSSSKYGRIASISDLVAIFRGCRRLDAGEEVVYALEQGDVPLKWVFFYAERLCLSLYIVPRHAKEVQEPYGIVASVDMFGEIAKHHRSIQKASIEDVVSISSLSAETLITIEKGGGCFDDVLKTLYAYGLELLIYPEQDSPKTKFDRHITIELCL